MTLTMSITTLQPLTFQKKNFSKTLKNRDSLPEFDRGVLVCICGIYVRNTRFQLRVFRRLKMLNVGGGIPAASSGHPRVAIRGMHRMSSLNGIARVACTLRTTKGEVPLMIAVAALD